MAAVALKERYVAPDSRDPPDPPRGTSARATSPTDKALLRVIEQAASIIPDRIKDLGGLDCEAAAYAEATQVYALKKGNFREEARLLLAGAFPEDVVEILLTQMDAELRSVT
jgi:hypothetical protein